jgi:hypothetical protein
MFTDGTVDNNDGDRLVDDLFYYSKYHDCGTRSRADAHFTRSAGTRGAIRTRSSRPYLSLANRT